MLFTSGYGATTLPQFNILKLHALKPSAVNPGQPEVNLHRPTMVRNDAASRKVPREGVVSSHVFHESSETGIHDDHIVIPRHVVAHVENTYTV